MQIYFAGSIRGGRSDHKLYAQIIELLRRHGEVLTEHVGSSALSAAGEDEPSRNIHDRDIAWLRTAGLMVAEVTTPSLGVGYEIGKASEWGIPTLCLFRPSSARSLSPMIEGCPGVTTERYTSAEDLPSIFERFFNA